MLLSICRRFSREINGGKASSLLPGTTRAIEVNGDKNSILVYNSNGHYYATGGKCSHYGAPFSYGAFVQEKIYCPWHCACFDIKTGEKLLSPGLQNIPSYPVSVNSEGDLLVKVPESVKDPAQFVDPELATHDPHNNTRFVIIGAGASGLACAETLRKNHFTGEILMITPENISPYDRVSLSKNFKMDALKTVLKSEEYYQKYGIQIRKNTSVTGIDEKEKNVLLGNGEKVKFDKALIASGSSSRVPRPLLEASKLENVGAIRKVEDHLRIKPLVESSNNIVIIGGSFLGLEAANALKSAFPSKSVTVIEQESVPLQRIMGPHIGKVLQKSAEAKGVSFILGKSVDSIVSSNNKATSISINSSQLPCDFILLATGAQINTSFVPESLLNADKSVRVSTLLQTDHPDIYAAGDVASFPSVYTASHSRIEHWTVAQDQGINAALNMLGKGIPYTKVPFFWSNQAVNIQYVGVPGEFGFNEGKNIGQNDEAHISYFFNGNRIAGVAIGNWPGAALTFKVLFERGILPNKQQLVNGFNYNDIVNLSKNLR